MFLKYARRNISKCWSGDCVAGCEDDVIDLSYLFEEGEVLASIVAMFRDRKREVSVVILVELSRKRFFRDKLLRPRSQYC